MAKFAKCGYGHDGRGLGATTDGYTYVVDDNVRTGDTLQVIATRAGRKYVTTASPLHTFKETSVKGQQAKQEVQEAGKDEITQAYTGKELGAKGSKVKDIPTPYGGDISQYQMAARAGNVAAYKAAHPEAKFTEAAQETFDTYSSNFMQGGNQ